MRDKFIVEIYDNNNNLITSQHFTSYKAIAQEYDIQYSEARKLNALCESRTTCKYLHPSLKRLINRIKIYDINNINNYDIKKIKI